MPRSPCLSQGPPQKSAALRCNPAGSGAGWGFAWEPPPHASTPTSRDMAHFSLLASAWPNNKQPCLGWGPEGASYKKHPCLGWGLVFYYLKEPCGCKWIFAAVLAQMFTFGAAWGNKKHDTPSKPSGHFPHTLMAKTSAIGACSVNSIISCAVFFWGAELNQRWPLTQKESPKDGPEVYKADGSAKGSGAKTTHQEGLLGAAFGAEAPQCL